MNFRNQWMLALGVGIIVLTLGAERSHAVGTAAGTSVTNRASVSFTGASGPQTVESSPTVVPPYWRRFGRI